MIDFTLIGTSRILAAMNDICTTSQSHITVAIYNNKIILGSLGPEFFKLYNTDCTVDIEDMAIRIPTKVMKTMCTTLCDIRFQIEAGVKIFRSLNGNIITGVTIPLEQDFNIELIASILADSKTKSEPCDISAISELRALVNYAELGLQCKDKLAFVQGPGFTAYHPVDNDLCFIMTKENISEFIKFATAHKHISMYESSIYTVFCEEGYFFGCKQPRTFVDSEYDEYRRAKQIYETTLNLSEFTNVLKAIDIPKGENPVCDFDMEHYVARIDLGNRGRYAIVIGKKDVSPVTGNSVKFKVSLESLKRILSTSAIRFDEVTLIAYKPFVVFRVGKNDFLVCKES